MRQKIEDLIEEWAEKPWLTISAFFVSVTTIYAVVQLIRDLPQPWAAVLVGVSMSVLVGPGLLWFLFLSFHRLYRVPLAERYVIADSHQEWHFRTDGSRDVSGTKTIVFYRPPRKADAFDVVFGSLDLGLHALPYSSPDARIVDSEQVSPLMCKLYWAPASGELAVGQPYKHTLVTRYPEGDSPTGKSITIATRVYTRKVRVTIRSERPIVRVLAFRGGLLRSYKSFAAIAKKARRLRRTHAPGVQMVNSMHCEWEADDVKPGAVYYILLSLSDSSAGVRPAKQ